MGKVYEKIINKRILNKVGGGNKLHNRQYGFREGRGTEDAVVQLLENVKTTEKIYLLGIFLDIAGAFDNAWWSKIVGQLNEFGVRGKEIGVIKDYVKGRYAIINCREVKKERC